MLHCMHACCCSAYISLSDFLHACMPFSSTFPYLHVYIYISSSSHLFSLSLSLLPHSCPTSLFGMHSTFGDQGLGMAYLLSLSAHRHWHFGLGPVLFFWPINSIDQPLPPGRQQFSPVLNKCLCGGHSFLRPHVHSLMTAHTDHAAGPMICALHHVLPFLQFLLLFCVLMTLVFYLAHHSHSRYSVFDCCYFLLTVILILSFIPFHWLHCSPLLLLCVYQYSSHHQDHYLFSSAAYHIWWWPLSTTHPTQDRTTLPIILLLFTHLPFLPVVYAIDTHDNGRGRLGRQG